MGYIATDIGDCEILMVCLSKTQRVCMLFFLKLQEKHNPCSSARLAAWDPSGHGSNYMGELQEKSIHQSVPLGP